MSARRSIIITGGEELQLIEPDASGAGPVVSTPPPLTWRIHRALKRVMQWMRGRRSDK